MMKKKDCSTRKIWILVVLIFTLSNTYAQKTDSISLGLRNQLYLTDSVTNAIYQFAKNNPFYMNRIPNQLNLISIGAQLDQGKFITAQQSTKTRDFYFNTEGKTTIKDIALFGAFTFHKTLEDSTRWAHQTRTKTSMPLYFGSVQPIHYERAVYTFQAMAEKNLLKNQLPLNFNLNYRIGNHFSNNDPRGNIKDYQFNTITTLAYQLSKLKAGLSFRYGYGSEEIGISYKNDNVKPFKLINWRSVGYGISEEFLSTPNYTNQQTRKGVDLNFDFAIHPKHQLMLSLSYLKEQEEYLLKAIGSNTVNRQLLDYDTKIVTANLFWQMQLEHHKLLFQLAYKEESGSDIYYPNGYKPISPTTVNDSYNNYLYNLQQLDFKLILSSNENKKAIGYQAFVGGNFTSEAKQDGSSGNNVIYDRLQVDGGITLNHALKNKKNYSLGLNALYSTTLSNTFIVPQINEKPFYQYVIYHDYLYQTATYAGLGLNGAYAFPAYKELQVSIKFNVNYTKPLGDLEPLDRIILSRPGNDRFSSNISLNLYF